MKGVIALSNFTPRSAPNIQLTPYNFFQGERNKVLIFIIIVVQWQIQKLKLSLWSSTFQAEMGYDLFQMKSFSPFSFSLQEIKPHIGRTWLTLKSKWHEDTSGDNLYQP